MGAGAKLRIGSICAAGILAISLLWMTAGIAAAQAPELLRSFCPKGSTAEQCFVPRGIASSSATGDIYVADQENHRINQFDAWGEPIRVWGWGVVASGPNNQPQNEIQKISVSATSGTFKLEYGDSEGFDRTTAIAFDASAASVQSALESLSLVGPGDATVTGTAGGPWTIEFVGALADYDVPQPKVFESTLAGGSATVTIETLQGGANYEICEPDAGDLCRAGQKGTKSGQLQRPAGVAVDSLGNVYVVDRLNHRVQKYDSSGHFILMFGGEVNKTTAENVCTAASGNECGVGVQGAAAGFFGTWPVGSYVGIGPGDTVLVGDTGRVQRFSPAGTFLGQITENIAGNTVQSLAVDGAGNLYVAFVSKSNVLKLSSSGGSICSMTVPNPRAVAVDASGVAYVVSKHSVLSKSEILEFNPDCSKIDLGLPEPGFGADELTIPTAIGVTSPPTCGLTDTDVLVANSDETDTFVNIYGPPPDSLICPPPDKAPSINDQFAVAATATSGTVKAVINPHFWADTRFYVEYGTGKCSEGGCSQQQPLPPGSQLTKKTVDAELVSTGVLLSELSPETTYNYRFVAESGGGGPVFGIDPDGEGGPGEATFADGLEGTFRTLPLVAEGPPCPNSAFRTGYSASLPNCRAYEMVSPVDKNNGDIGLGVGNFGLISPDGIRATFTSIRSFADPAAAPFSSQYLADREASGWSTRSIAAPRTSLSLYETGGPPQAIQYKAFTPDLCSGWVLQDSFVALVEGAPEGLPNLYRRQSCGEKPEYELLTPTPPPGFPPFEIATSVFFPEMQGMSADGTQSAFRADGALTPDACTTPEKMFQVYKSAPNVTEPGKARLDLVSIKTNGQPACTHSSVGVTQGLPGEFREDNVHNAMSTDGERIYWTMTNFTLPVQEGGGKGDQSGALFLRINATKPQSAAGCEPEKACTVEVSGLVSPSPVRFWTATPSGSKALFSTGSAGFADGSLYVYDAASESAQPIVDGFRGLMGASSDLSRIYLVSDESLDAGAAAGEPNLYLWEAGTFSFIGTLADKDVRNSATAAPPSPIATDPRKRSSRVTADGGHAAFMSIVPLTGFDNTDIASGEPDAEVFLYDAEANGGAGKLICVSCSYSGVRPSGRNLTPGVEPQNAYWGAAQLPGWIYQLTPGRALKDDGSRLFFMSFEALVSRDTNGAQDVYQWEQAASKAICTEQLGGELFDATSESCLSLISSGESPVDSEFLDASVGGLDAYFATNASLVEQDPGLIDVYDARVNGGFPPPEIPKEICEGESCQAPPPAPEFPAPASEGTQGNGQFRSEQKTKKCPKGKHKVKRKGKVVCVKNKKNKKKAKGSKASKGAAR